MCNSIVILGAGGHAKVIADIVIKSGYSLKGFLDDNIDIGTTIIKYNKTEYKVIGKTSNCLDLTEKNKDLKFIIGIGNNNARHSIAQKYDLSYITLIHPSANISIETSIGEGTVIMANATINASSSIGKHCIINTGAIIEHDNKIGNYVHISPNATLGGTVIIDNECHVGIGATIKNNISICENCIIGAGAVVVKDLTEKGTYIGVPIKKMK